MWITIEIQVAPERYSLFSSRDEVIEKRLEFTIDGDIEDISRFFAIGYWTSEHLDDAVKELQQKLLDQSVEEIRQKLETKETEENER